MKLYLVRVVLIANGRSCLGQIDDAVVEAELLEQLKLQ